MIWWILGVPAALLLVLACIVLFSPFRLRIQRLEDEQRMAVGIRLAWLHPRVTDLDVRLPGGPSRLVLLSRYTLWHADGDESEEQSDRQWEEPEYSASAAPQPWDQSASREHTIDYGGESVDRNGDQTTEEDDDARHRVDGPADAEEAEGQSRNRDEPEPDTSDDEAFHGNGAEDDGVPDSYREEARFRDGDLEPPAQRRAPPPSPFPSEPSAPADVPPASDEASGRKKKPSLFRRIREHRITFLLSQRRWMGKLLRWLLRVLRTLLRLVRLERLSLGVSAATGDPALTGMLSGGVTGLRYALTANERNAFRLDFVPLFEDRPRFDWDGCLQLSSSVARLLWPVVVALFTFPYLSSLLLWRRMKVRERTAQDEE